MKSLYKIKALPLFITMSAAFIFGYGDLLFPMNFERLHIFLFNLTSGGFTILYLTNKRQSNSIRLILFFLLSILFAITAFFKLYLIAALCGVILAIIVETFREERFGFFPYVFFKPHGSSSEKFHQASLLCLVIALLLSSFVIINEVYLKLFYYEKLTLDVFFLGFSFPVSLITFSIIFSIFEDSKRHWVLYAEHFSFWTICAGVIIFFLFIIAKSFAGEVFISFTLFFTVIFIFVLFKKFGKRVQQKYFLVSGIYFLMATAITGILYILLKQLYYDEFLGKLILRMHAFYSLYGWNLTGMMVIIRWKDFPIALNTRKAIIFHWAVVLILAPLAKIYNILAIPAIISYIAFISVFFFSKNKLKKIL
ncbi:MAG: hypothetical protein BWY23_02131 [Spirochaetes bacterium ADurb.Bin218]|jgi:hypothetical protein|nr:MAG: hypothetical protein BWY23_02131 [Spirochaetes bacterium ADurb.Bin218]